MRDFNNEWNQRQKAFDRSFKRTGYFITFIGIFVMVIAFSVIGFYLWLGFQVIQMGPEGVGHTIGTIMHGVQEGLHSN